jgi:hypothetical protein
VNRDAPNTFDFATSEEVVAQIMNAQNNIKTGTVPTYVKNSGADLHFATGVNYDRSSSVSVNGETLPENAYTILQVSGDYLMQHPETLEDTTSAKSFEKDLDKFNYYTLFTLKSQFLDALNSGDHNFKVNIANLQVNAVPFVVVDVGYNSPAAVAKNFFETNWTWLLMVLLVLLVSGGFYLFEKRGRKNAKPQA